MPKSVALIALVQEKKLVAEVANIEADTGVRVRVLAQNYPETPGKLTSSNRVSAVGCTACRVMLDVTLTQAMMTLHWPGQLWRLAVASGLSLENDGGVQSLRQSLLQRNAALAGSCTACCKDNFVTSHEII